MTNPWMIFSLFLIFCLVVSWLLMIWSLKQMSGVVAEMFELLKDEIKSVDVDGYGLPYTRTETPMPPVRPPKRR